MISTVKPDEMHPHEAAQVGTPDAALGQRVFGFAKLAKRTTDTVVSEIVRNVANRLASGKVSEGSSYSMNRSASP